MKPVRKSSRILKQIKLQFSIVEKSAPESKEHYIAGWAYTSAEVDGSPVFDHSGDVIPLRVLAKAMRKWFKQNADSGDMHEGDADPGASGQELVITSAEVQKAWAHDCPSCGHRIEKFMPEGAWIRLRVPESTVQKVKNGDRLMFSMQGRGAKYKMKVAA